MTVKIVTFHGLEPGPRFTVLGAVHGNERCGAGAIRRLIADIDAGTHAPVRGTLHLVPVTNPEAFRRNVRFVERNLNRYLYPKDEKKAYEDYLDPIVCGLLDRTDVLLDLHSYTSQGGPFIFLGTDQGAELAYARSLGVSDFVCGWSEAFGSGTGRESQGTTEYARLQGALAVTLECGHHHNADAAGVGYRGILRAMVHLGMIGAADLAPEPAGGAQRFVRMKSVYRREEGAALAKPWRHFDPVAKGEAMATLADGRILDAPEDGFIILPKASADTGAEWFYFGAGIPPPN